MLYYVDGYNLIFRTLSAGESLRHRRETLIADIHPKIELLKLETVLVFDSQYQNSEATRHHFKDLEIYYTDEGETADDYIVKAVKRHPNRKEVTVVTSDLRLAWRVRREHALTMSAEDYLQWLQRRYRNKVEQVRLELSKEIVTKIPLPKLLPEPNAKPKKETLKLRQSDMEFYMEQFGGTKEEGEVGEDKKKLDKRILKEKPFKHNDESDFERWLREFGG